MPTEQQIKEIKTLCLKFAEHDFLVYFGIAPNSCGSYGIVRIIKDRKEWNFCDPDWNVLKKQINCLYKAKINQLN